MPLGAPTEITVYDRVVVGSDGTPAFSNERVRNTETRIVEGAPAKALLEVAGSNPANVIVVGNRGLGAADGQLLGSVPGDVAKNAACDVLIVHTGEQDGDPVTVQATESDE